VARNIATRRLLRSRLKRNGGGAGAAPRWFQVIIALTGLAVLGVAVAGGVGYGVYQAYASGLQPPDQVISSLPSGGAQIFDRNGKLLYQYVDDKSGLRSPVKLADISPWMIAATISTEDDSFWTNNGVNTKGLIRAGLENLGLRKADASATTGGSSITEQLVKNVYIPVAQRSQRSYTRKLKETIYALELTNRYSKNQILEWYLNQISYGGLYNGVEAAAEGYFGVHAKDLTMVQAAMLAGIPASPVQYDPINNPTNAIARRNQVLQLMQSRNRVEVDDGSGTGKKVKATRFQVNQDGTTIVATDPMFYLSTLAPLNLTPQHFPVQAPHFVFNVIEPQLVQQYGEAALHQGGLRVTTSLDLDLQQKAQDALDKWIGQYQDSTGGHNGAFVSINPTTSEVLVYIGSRDYFDTSIQGQVDNANPAGGRSPGSSLKPFTYTAAFEDLGWGPNTEILDTPITYNDGVNPPFTPSNPEHNFIGPAPVHIALGNSLNVPAFKTALYVGVQNVVNEYKKFGITGLDGQSVGPSVTIGGVDVKLYDVTYAYSVLADGGVMRGVPTTQTLPAGNRTLDPVTILQISRQDGTILYPTTPDHRVNVQQQKVVDPQYAYMITSILSDPNNTCLTWGCGIFDIGRPMAVKTGASQPYTNSTSTADTWTYAYTPDLVAGAWFGNADSAPTYNLFSTTVAWAVVRDFMKAALANTPSTPFTRPPGLVNVNVCEPSGMKPTPACGRVINNLLPADKVPTQDDTWWQKASVDIRNGLLASPLTPPQFAQDRFGLQVPDSVQGFARDQALEWAKVLNTGVVPVAQSNGQSPVSIDSPKNGSQASGVVYVYGTADSPDFVAYRLEYGAGPSPSSWTLITRSTSKPVNNGLGLWNTAGLPDGSYTLRLVLETKTSGELSTVVTVNIGANIRVSPTFTPTPTLDTGTPADTPAPADTPTPSG
jgi:membrane peptidoglycan carboxypeptidase